MVLALKDISVAYSDGQVAVANASMELAPGDKLLLCGAAGGGKSTLLNVAAGVVPRLVRPHRFSGSVLFDGAPIASLPKDALFARIGMVMQNVEEQLWDLGVEDLIAFPLENRGMARADIRERLQTMLGTLELDALRGRRVLSLSGGERRMVAIAAALAATPELLILDEPTTGLDPAARERLVRILKTVASDGPALLVAEQDPGALESVTRSVRFLHSGRLSEPMEMAAAFGQQTPWLDAGILPPVRKPAYLKRVAPGDELLGVSGLRTVLTRQDGSPVLRDVSLTIRAGEIVALIGRNGTGKTTLVQSILGMAKAAAGTIRIRGGDATGWTVARRARSIAYLPQNMRRILFNMTVLEEVLFAITAGGAAGPDEKARAVEALAQYGLETLSEANPFGLSARQQALLGLACAHAAQAPVSILDEPLLARDVQGRQMLDRFLENAIAGGRAVLLISHDLDLVEEVASRMLILDRGEVVFDGSTGEGWSSAAFASLGWPRPPVLMEKAA